MGLEVGEICKRREKKGKCGHYYCDAAACCINIIHLINEDQVTVDAVCCEISLSSFCPHNGCGLQYKGDKRI